MLSAAVAYQHDSGQHRDNAGQHGTPVISPEQLVELARPCIDQSPAHTNRAVSWQAVSMRLVV